MSFIYRRRETHFNLENTCMVASGQLPKLTKPHKEQVSVLLLSTAGRFLFPGDHQKRQYHTAGETRRGHEKLELGAQIEESHKERLHNL